MYFTGQDIHNFMTKAGLDAVSVDAVERLMKDSVPARDAESVRLYSSNSPFTMIQDEITSLAVPNSSPLVNWLPSRDIKDRAQTVSHLDYVAPKGFTGKETYPEWLASVEIGECGYGPTTTFSGFSYQMTGGSFSWKTDTMKPYEDGGMKYYEKFPTYTVRGGNGIPLANDRDWAIARVLLAAQTHLDYVVRSGDAMNSQMEWDGIDQILRVNYVQNHLIGNSPATWADPLVINGIGLTIPQVLQAIRIMVRNLLNRSSARNWQVASEDIAVYMPKAMWDVISEDVAAGGMHNFVGKAASYGFAGNIEASAYMAELNRIRNAGVFNSGAIDVDGRSISIMTDVNYGVTRDIAGGTGQGVLGDIMVLTRRANGFNLWEQQYVNYGMLDYPAINESQVALQQGKVRAGWVTESNKCYYYYVEMAGRVVCTMLPLQGRINNVFIPMASGDAIEAGAFYQQDFYAFNRRRGGMGVNLLRG